MSKKSKITMEPIPKKTSVHEKKETLFEKIKQNLEKKRDNIAYQKQAIEEYKEYLSINQNQSRYNEFDFYQPNIYKSRLFEKDKFVDNWIEEIFKDENLVIKYTETSQDFPNFITKYSTIVDHSQLPNLFEGDTAFVSIEKISFRDVSNFVLLVLDEQNRDIQVKIHNSNEPIPNEFTDTFEFMENYFNQTKKDVISTEDFTEDGIILG